MTIAPKGFENLEARNRLADDIVSMIDEYDACMASEGLVTRWKDVQAVYDDEKVLSSLDFIDDVEPYNVAFMQTRIDSLVDHVCGAICGADPVFVFRSSEIDDTKRENVEKDIHYLLETARFKSKTRECCLESGLKSRGILRLRYEEIKRDNLHDHEDLKNLNIGSEYQYVGLVIDHIPPESAIVTPLYAEDVSQATMVGHRKYMRLGDIRARQRAGIYFSDKDVPAGDESGQSSKNEDAHGKWIADVEVRTKPDGCADELRYRCVLHIQSRTILSLEEYRLPRSSYFSPALRSEPNRFWAKKSIAHKMLETQTIYNDAVTMAIFGTAAEAFPNVVTSGGMAESQKLRMGLNSLIHVKNPMNIQPVGARFNPGAIAVLTQLCERIGDSIAKISQAGMGQEFMASTTATAAAGMLAGQARGLSAQISRFGEELVNMADFARYLAAVKFKELKAFHGSQLKTSDPSDYLAHFLITLNGSAGTDPMSIIQKLELLVQTATGLGVSIDARGTFETILNALDLPVSTSKILPEQDAIGEQLGNVPPEQLLGLLEQLRNRMAAHTLAGGIGGPQDGTLPSRSGSVPDGTVPLPRAD